MDLFSRKIRGFFFFHLLKFFMVNEATSISRTHLIPKGPKELKLGLVDSLGIKDPKF